MYTITSLLLLPPPPQLTGATNIPCHVPCNAVSRGGGGGLCNYCGGVWAWSISLQRSRSRHCMYDDVMVVFMHVCMYVCMYVCRIYYSCELAVRTWTRARYSLVTTTTEVSAYISFSVYVHTPTYTIHSYTHGDGGGTAIMRRKQLILLQSRILW